MLYSADHRRWFITSTQEAGWAYSRRRNESGTFRKVREGDHRTGEVIDRIPAGKWEAVPGDEEAADYQ